MKKKFDKRIHDLKTQNKDIKTFLAHSSNFVETKLNPVIEKKFSESICIAVTQVNGCKLCSYTHTEGALKSGMSEDEINYLLSGDFNNAPKEQFNALVFAQHYADTEGNPTPEATKKLIESYGEEKTKDIMSSILIMMVTNLHGNTMEAFKLRLKGNGVQDSSFFQELAVIINFFKIMPVILYKIIEYKFFKKKIVRI